MDSFAESDIGNLYVANGMGSVLRFDGVTDSVELAGLAAPTETPVITGSAAETYFCFVRFLDRFGYVSDLSPASEAMVTDAGDGEDGEALGADIVLMNVSSAYSFGIVTAAAHGFTAGQSVRISGVPVNTVVNGVWEIDYTPSSTVLVISLPRGGGRTLGLPTGETTVSGSVTASTSVAGGGGPLITYSNIQVPSDPKVVRRQILRNTAQQADTFYVDIDTDDLVATTFTSDREDNELAQQEAQPLLDAYSRPLANTHGIPPDHKPFLAYHLGRMFYGGQRDYKRGMVKLTNGSATVTGVGTDWISALEGRYLHVDGATQSYQIDSVDVPAQTLTLTEVFQGTTTDFGLYAIRPAPAERRLIYYSEAGQPESVPAFNALSLPEDGDEVTGLMQRSSYIFILEKRHIYKLTFQDDPQKDGAVFLASRRGCINNRSWVLVDERSFMLDEEGIHMFGGGAQAISTPIQEIFRESDHSAYEINWQAQDYFHAVHFRAQNVVRWFVTMQGTGSYFPKHAICYNYLLGRWWIEKYPQKISSSCVGTLNRVDQVFLGGEARTVIAPWQGTLDFANPDASTVRGTATASATYTLTDSTATFGADVVGAPVVIVDGTGKGQERIIAARSSTVLTVTEAWATAPDTTSVYQVGGIVWNWKSSWFRFAANKTDEPRRLEIVYQPTTGDVTMDVTFYVNFSSTAEVQFREQSSTAGGGVRATKGLAPLTVDLSKATGLVQMFMPGHKEYMAEGRRFSQFEFSGVSAEDPVSIYQVAYEGVANVTQIEQPG